MSSLISSTSLAAPVVLNGDIVEEIHRSATRAQLLSSGNEAYRNALKMIEEAEHDRDYMRWEKNDIKRKKRTMRMARDEALVQCNDARRDAEVALGEIRVLKHQMEKLETAYDMLVERLIAELVAVKPVGVATALGEIIRGEIIPSSDDEEQDAAKVVRESGKCTKTFDTEGSLAVHHTQCKSGDDLLSNLLKWRHNSVNGIENPSKKHSRCTTTNIFQQGAGETSKAGSSQPTKSRSKRGQGSGRKTTDKAPSTQANFEGEYFEEQNGLPEPEDARTLDDLCDSPSLSTAPDPQSRRWWTGLGRAVEVAKENFFAPFMNTMVYRLMLWFYEGSAMKTQKSLDDLVQNVLLAPDFDRDHLEGFSAAWEFKRLDDLSMGPELLQENGWIPGSVKIRLPCLSSELEGGHSDSF
ncbi:hypothetical protein NP233_g12314 [Leucocoprinus birnbaumii]|uniref:Uncharacterized protein n=1 Tax=Leucocoprinus birnbaumii TaxID=56174 RepID=A0AAD5VFX1_9AGAR|nr:hypothetical protein NP233_g12314 [Leucocoprinus birnbaumii]